MRLQKFPWPPLIVSFLAFIVYVLTLAPSVLFIDSGELAADATILGIAHPTGYPLFTMVGYVFSHLPIGGTAVWRLNIMAAVFCSLGAGAMTVLVQFILTEISAVVPHRGGDKKKKSAEHAVKISDEISERAAVFGGMFAGLMLAFSQTFWSQATAVEVYALHCLLVPSSIYFFLRYCREKPMQVYSKWGVLWAVTWGLSFSNHMTSILLIPAFIVFFFMSFGWTLRSVTRGMMLLLPFAVGLAPYLYLPIRASMHPALNWGNPVTIENFIRHWTGHQYQVWMFTSFDSAGKQLKYFLGDFPTEFGLMGLIPVLLGAVALYRQSKAMFVFVAILLVTCVLYSINYDIHDIDSYFLLAYFATAICCGVGAWWLIRGGSLRTIALPVLAMCVALNIVQHYKGNDESHDFMVHDYTLNLLNSLPQNALIISWQWDFFVAGSIYFQNVEHVRPDIMVIDKELLRRTWYLDQIHDTHPDVYERSRYAIEPFYTSLQKFERDEPYDVDEIEAQYRAVIKSFIADNMHDRPIFVTGELEKDYTLGFSRIPEGLAYRLYLKDEFVDVPFPSWKYRDMPRRNYYTDKIREMYIFIAAARGKYLSDRGKYAEALPYFNYALTFQPHGPITENNPTSANLGHSVQMIVQSRDECQSKLRTLNKQ